jgi:WD40 repeat protein
VRHIRLLFICAAHCILVWDVRAFKKPLASKADLRTLYPNTNAVFSPDDKYIITGAGSPSQGRAGRLLFLRKNNLDVVKELEVDATPVRVAWHPKINQVWAMGP